MNTRPSKPHTDGFAVDRHVSLDDQDDVNALVDFCLEHMGQPPPSASFFGKLAGVQPPQQSLDTIQARLFDNKKQHSKDLEKLYDFQVGERTQLYLEQRTNMDGGDYYPNPEIGFRKDPGQKYMPIPVGDWEAAASVYKQTLTFDDTISCYNHAFIQTQMPLYAQVGELKEKQRLEEEERNMTLPTSMEEFDAITSREYQIRVARFLESDGKTALPPAVINKSTPEGRFALLIIYKHSAAFKRKVADLLTSIQSTDPRKRKPTGD